METSPIEKELGLVEWIWGVAVVLMAVTMVVLFGRRLRHLFSPEGSRRYDITEIPPDDPETREFIVRDDQTGARMQFTTLHEIGRVVEIVVPAKHQGTGVEGGLFEAALPAAEQVTSWSWPPMNRDAYAATQALARSLPQLIFIDANGMRL